MIWLPEPLPGLISWCLSWQRLLAVGLVVATIMTTFGVSWAAFQTRQLYSRLQVLDAASVTLEGEYEKLLLEQSAWAAYQRIDDISRNELGMRAPVAEQLVVVNP